MGFLKSYLIEKVTEKTEDFLIEKALTKVGEKILEYGQKKHQNDVQEFCGKTTSHSRLLLSRKRWTFKETFNVCDADNNVKYVIKGKLLSVKHQLHIFDATGKKEIGLVKEKIFAFRLPFNMESNPKDFELFVHGNKIGKMKSKFSFGKHKFVFDFNDWVLEGDVFGLKYKVLDGEELIMEVNNKSLFAPDDMYFLDIIKPENELICLLLALAIDSARVSKLDETKETINHKIVF